MSFNKLERSLTVKEEAFIKWYLRQQKKALIIISVVFTPIILLALGGMIYAIKDELTYLEPMDYIVLFGGCSFIITLIGMAVKFVFQKTKGNFLPSVVHFSGIYKLEQVAKITSGIQTYSSMPVMLPTIGDYIFAASDAWQFNDGEFYYVEAVPLKLSSMESALYKTTHKYLLLKSQINNNEIDIEKDVDLGLLDTNSIVPGTLLILAVLFFALGLPFYIADESDMLDIILIGLFSVSGICIIWSILKLMKGKRSVSKIREHYNSFQQHS